MLRNFFKVALRNMLRHKGFSLINILGLGIGMACTLLIYLFVQNELSYDRFHKDADRIHRVVKDFVNDDGSLIPDATSQAGLAPAMQRELPEIETTTRVFPPWGGTTIIEYADKKIAEPRLYRVDSSFFQVFNFPVLKGDATNPLRDINSIILTESSAKRYFGNDDPIGKVLQLNGLGDKTVTAVIKDVPSNAHFSFDFLISFKTLGPNVDANWGQYNYYTYVKVRENTNLSVLNTKIQDLYERSQDEKESIFYTQPLIDIHLSSHLKWELEPNSDRLYVYVFSIIGIFIIVIAAINYINLSTAKSSIRAKEIGIRKVAGAVRGSLIQQFLLESVMTCLIAAVFALIIAQLLIPVVNELTQKSLSVVGNPIIILYLFVSAIIIGAVAGIFPALYLSSFRPISVLKGFKLNDSGALNLRKVLVVVQFTISIVLIIGALIIAQQMNFIKSTKLGYDKDQVLVIKSASTLSRSDREAFVNSIRQIPGVLKVATATGIIGEGFNTSRLSAKGSNKEQQVNFSFIGNDYLDVVGIELKEGRGFSKNNPADSLNNGIPGGPLEQTIGGIVINERAVRELNLGSPAVGRQLLWGTDQDTSYYVEVIGVMKDFHFTSLRNEIKPFAFLSIPNANANINIKLSTANISQVINQLETMWSSVSGDLAFDYVFLDETFDRLYAAESRFQKVFIALVVLGILVACLGLLGLATYAAQQRIKEIGIRKTLGASVSGIVGLLSKDFLKLVCISFVLAVPIGWYAMNKWLQDFTYRIDINWWIFLVAGIVALLIAFLTISIQTIRAARTNPVNSLRAE